VSQLGSSDIAAILADLKEAGGGVDVTLGATTVTALLDVEAAELFQGDMPPAISADQVVHLPVGALPGLVSGAAVTVDEIPYLILKVHPYGDGAMARVALRKP